jgi:hypothetical protein
MDGMGMSVGEEQVDDPDDLAVGRIYPNLRLILQQT